MDGSRRLRILDRLIGGGGGELDMPTLCQVTAEITQMTGGGVMLMSGDIPRGSVCATDGVSTLIEELQFALGEGPCVDAYHHDRPIVEPDLAQPAQPRWIAFTPPAVAAGARAVFGFPLQIGAVRLGALNLYRDSPGGLTDDQYADALVLAGISAQAVLLIQAKAPPGQVAAELDSRADFQYVVHQASGMVAAQLAVRVAHALIRLRAYSFANELPLRQVAEDVVNRRLRFDGSGGQDVVS